MADSGWRRICNTTTTGFDALGTNTTGFDNTATGVEALRNTTTGTSNTATGRNARPCGNRTTTTGLGANAAVTANDQTQLGDSALGLAFITTALRPVDSRHDLRSHYRLEMPTAPAANATEAERAAHRDAMAAWTGASKPRNLRSNGTHTGTRFHHGFVAQEVGGLLAERGIAFGGFQDHTVNGGEDVLSLGYDEFIAPMIKAIQELAARNDALASEKKDLAGQASAPAARVAELEA